MLFGPKQRVHSGRIPDHCDWPKLNESFDYTDSLSIAMLLRKAAAARHGSQEKTGSQNEVETELHFLTSCTMYDHIRDTYFAQIAQIHK